MVVVFTNIGGIILLLYMVVYSDPITLSLILPDLSDIALSGNKIFVLLLNYQLKILLIILLIISELPPLIEAGAS